MGYPLEKTIQEQCFEVVRDNPGITSMGVAQRLKMDDDLICVRWHLFLLRRDDKINQTSFSPAQYYLR